MLCSSWADGLFVVVSCPAGSCFNVRMPTLSPANALHHVHPYQAISAQAASVRLGQGNAIIYFPCACKPFSWFRRFRDTPHSHPPSSLRQLGARTVIAKLTGIVSATHHAVGDLTRASSTYARKASCACPADISEPPGAHLCQSTLGFECVSLPAKVRDHATIFCRRRSSVVPRRQLPA